MRLKAFFAEPLTIADDDGAHEARDSGRNVHDIAPSEV